MSSHVWPCIMCGAEVWCHNDSHDLRYGDGCYGQEHIEFCTIYCQQDYDQLLDKPAPLYADVYEHMKQYNKTHD